MNASFHRYGEKLRRVQFLGSLNIKGDVIRHIFDISTSIGIQIPILSYIACAFEAKQMIFTIVHIKHDEAYGIQMLDNHHRVHLISIDTNSISARIGEFRQLYAKVLYFYE